MTANLFSIRMTLLCAGIAFNVSAQGQLIEDGNFSFSTDLDASINQYQEKIEELENTSGPLAADLSEHLMGLGLLYKGLDRYDEASDALQRSLQIIRTNEGLESMSQAAVLDDLIDVNFNAGSWEKLDQNYHQLFWVYKRNLEADDPRLLEVIDSLGRWKLNAYSRKLLDDSPHVIINDAVTMYRKTVKHLESTNGEHDPSLIVPLNGLAYTGYISAIEVMNTPVDRFTATGTPTINQTVCNVVMVNGQARRVCRTQTMPNPDYYASKQRDKNNQIQRESNGVRRVLEQMIRIHETNPDLPLKRHAEAIVRLGDYYMVFGRSKATAKVKYREAYELLSSNENDKEDLDKLFGTPVRLPSFSSVFSPESMGANTDKSNDMGKVTLLLDVNKAGKPRNISVAALDNEQDKKSHRSLIRRMKKTIFRPRIVDGEPVETLQMSMKVSSSN